MNGQRVTISHVMLINRPGAAGPANILKVVYMSCVDVYTAVIRYYNKLCLL